MYTRRFLLGAMPQATILSGLQPVSGFLEYQLNSINEDSQQQLMMI